MDAALSVVEVPVDNENYLLDLNTDIGGDDFDFKLDGPFQMDEQQSAEAGAADVVPNPVADEIDYEDDEIQTSLAGTEHTSSNENNEANKDDATLDEIGYDEVEQTVASVAAEIDARRSRSLSARLSPRIPEERQEHHGSFDDQTQGLEADPAAAGDAEPVFDESAGDLMLHDGFEYFEGELDSTGSLKVTTADDRTTPGSALNDFEAASDGVSAVSSDYPDITVIYNQGQYSLIGGPDDDPDSYFLARTAELDGPLSQLLSSIREVISDEIAPEDELMVRINALGLEFGEKSNTKFLGRSFRDVFECFIALAPGSPAHDSDFLPTLELEFLIRRDSEARFLELLEEAKIAGGQSNYSDHIEGFEGADDGVSANAEGDGQLHGELLEEYSEQYEAEGLDAVAAPSINNASQSAAGDDEPAETEAAEELDDDIMGETFDLQVNPGESESAELAQSGSGGEITFEEEAEYQEGYTEEYPEETAGGESYPDDEIDVSGELGDDSAVNQSPEAVVLGPDDTMPFSTEQESNQQGSDEQAGLGLGEASFTDDVGAALATESASDDVDVTLTMDEDTALATIHEQGSVSNDVAPNSTHSNATNSSEAHETNSHHTSTTSTINGDQLGYDDHNQANEYVATGAENGEETVEENDEIDWGNDGDDDEEKTSALTPSGISGKRDRTNEVEYPDDETDHKRRRT